MPGGDRTGPMGMGAMSGRAGGYCAGYRTPGYANPGFGRGGVSGFGRGRGYAGRGFGGGGRGWRNRFFATGMPAWRRFGGYAAPYGPQAPYGAPDPQTAQQALKRQADALQAELDAIRQRLAGDDVAGTGADAG